MQYAIPLDRRRQLAVNNSMATLSNIADAPAGTDWLFDPRTQRVFSAISAGGFEIRAVGGAVRNALMGLPVGDIDMATDAPWDDVVRLARAAGLKAIETGVQHGTVTVVADELPVEVTTLRTDVETDGRHATVAFTQDWAADAARRDFTVNALYCDADGKIFDPLGGHDDIVASRIRFIGDPVDRIQEDYLRILRFFRFSAAFGNGVLDAEGLAAVTNERHGLRRISAERISVELKKTLAARRALPVVVEMARSGILSAVLATAPQTARLANLIAAEEQAGVPPDPLRRLAALSVYVSDDGTRLAARLRLARDERERLGNMGRARQIPLSSPKTIREALYRLGLEHFMDLAIIKAATERRPDLAREWIDCARSWSIPTFPVSGSDLLSRGMSPGPELGQRLGSLEEEWIASDFALSQSQLLASLKPANAERKNTE